MRPIVVPMSDIAPQRIDWLWPGLLPRGKLVLLCGDPGLGKSFITLDLAARASRGGPWPFAGDAPARPLRSILLSAEDDPADTIRPRLERMGADLSRICVLEGVQDAASRVHEFVIGDHATDLAGLLDRQEDTGLIVVDPVSAYVGASDSYNNAQVRAMLRPLAALAADYGVCVVLVTHLRKAEAARLLHSAMGSLAFAAAARVVVMVARNPADPRTRMLCTVKSNLACDRSGFEYRIEDGRVEWLGRVEVQADELLGRPAGSAGGAGARERQRAFAQQLRGLLAERGEVPSAEVEALARALGVNWEAVSRAAFKRQHGFRTLKRESAWYWTTGPDEPEPEEPEPEESTRAE